MKKLVFTTLAVTLVLAAILCGPDLLGAYRLQQYMSASDQAYVANGGPWPQLSDGCVACHGTNGNSVNQLYPALAGQRPEYLAAQLRDFATGQRVHPIMNAVARSLTQKDIAWLADHFARQGAIGNSYFKPDDRLRQRGAQIVSAGGCTGCHGEGLMGKDRFPRVAGQSNDYLLRQLNAFADSTRRDPANIMNQLASSWSPDDRAAIATFLASHPVTGSGKP